VPGTVLTFFGRNGSRHLSFSPAVGQQHLGPEPLQLPLGRVQQHRRLARVGGALPGWRPWAERDADPVDGQVVDLGSPPAGQGRRAAQRRAGRSIPASTESGEASASSSSTPAVNARQSPPPRRRRLQRGRGRDGSRRRPGAWQTRKMDSGSRAGGVNSPVRSRGLERQKPTGGQEARFRCERYRTLKLEDCGLRILGNAAVSTERRGRCARRSSPRRPGEMPQRECLRRPCGRALGRRSDPGSIPGGDVPASDRAARPGPCRASPRTRHAGGVRGIPWRAPARSRGVTKYHAFESMS
jgi:hypothetical protein